MLEQTPYLWRNECFHSDSDSDACVDMKYIGMHYLEKIQILGG
jgi:hypothetical protein